jgi:hypothetical protein
MLKENIEMSLTEMGYEDEGMDLSGLRQSPKDGL